VTAVVTVVPVLAGLAGVLIALRVDEARPAALVALQMVAAALVLVAGIVALARGAWSGNAPPALRGAALVVVALAVLGPGAVRGASAVAAGPSDPWLVSTTLSSIACGGLLVASARWPEVDTRVRPARLLGAVIAGVVLAVVVDAGAVDPVTPQTQGIVAAAAWGVAVVIYLAARQGRTPRAPLWPPAAMLALAGGFAAGAAEADAAPRVGAVLHLVAGAIAASGAAAALLADAVLHRRRVDRLRQLVADAVARADGSQSVLADASHDLGNAVTAIVGAAETIARHVDRLDPPTRSALLEGLAEQATRVHAVVSAVVDGPRRAQQTHDAADRRQIRPTVARAGEPHDN
jgi:signal transduction histidine kinase